jgi:hypothetical protein
MKGYVEESERVKRLRQLVRAAEKYVGRSLTGDLDSESEASLEQHAILFAEAAILEDSSRSKRLRKRPSP